MFNEDVKYFLNQYQIRYSEFEQNNLSTPFGFLYLTDNQLIIHLVELNNTSPLPLSFEEKGSNRKYFFQELSNHFNAQNLKIIHLWEDIWINKKAICQSRILAMCGVSERIPARLTQVRRIDKPTMDKFLNENHLQDSTTAKFKYGLFLPERYFRVIKNQNQKISESQNQEIKESKNQRIKEFQNPRIPEFQNPRIKESKNPRTPESQNPKIPELLTAVASFSNAKTIIREGKEFRSYELIRFANLCGMTVVGGLDKLLKTFINEHNPDDIMTYADRDWSDGRSYEKLGFQRIENTSPQGFYLDEKLLVRYYENKLNEHQKVGLKPVFNAGNVKFIKFLDN